MNKAVFALTLFSTSSWFYLRTRRLETDRRFKAFREKNYEELSRGYNVLGMEFPIFDKNRLTLLAIFTEDIRALQAINSNDVRTLYYLARTDFTIECCMILPELFPPNEVMELALQNGRFELIEKLRSISNDNSN